VECGCSQPLCLWGGLPPLSNARGALGQDDPSNHGGKPPLVILSSNKPLSADEAYQTYAAPDEEPSPLTSHPQGGENVSAFFEDLSQTYPDLDAVPEEEVDNSPWTVGFWLDVLPHPRPYHVLFIAWDRVDEVAPFVKRLAQKHNLVCYDPQEHSVTLPEELRRMTDDV